MMTHVSLFSGVGGFDLAAEWAGFTTVLFAEKDEHCQKVLRRHWPNVPIIEDVRRVGDIEKPTIISGGFPCQDLSVAGRHAGLAGEQSGLWWEFHRILATVRPTWTVIENVPGLLSSNGGRDMGTILWALGQLGYGFAYRVFDAQYCGVAQRRRRVFIVGHLGNGRRAAEVLLEPEGLCGDSPPCREKEQEVAGSLGGGSPHRGFGTGELDTHGAYIVGNVAGTITGHRGGVCANDAEKLVAAFHGDHSADFSMDYTEDKAPPMRTGHTGLMLQHGASVRRLTPLECERLQGFPDGWTAGHSDSQRYKMLGNAVAVPVAYRIAKAIAETVYERQKTEVEKPEGHEQTGEDS